MGEGTRASLRETAGGGAKPFVLPDWSVECLQRARARAPPAVASLEWQGAGGGAPSEPGGGEGGKEERGVSEPDAPGGEGGGGSTAAASASAAWD